MTKWEDKWLGILFQLVMNNKGLEYFKTQFTLMSRQLQWTDFLSRFQCKMNHVTGKINILLDTLSQYYKDFGNDVEIPPENHIQIDVRLDLDMETISIDQKKELKGNQLLFVITARKANR